MPAMLATVERTYPRASARVAVPDDVYDVMLWRLAFDVAAAHQPGPTGNCINTRCTGRRGPCEPATHARQALRAARRPPSAGQPPQRPATPPVTTPATASVAVGRGAVVAPGTGQFTGWFTHTAVTGTNGRRDDLRSRHVPDSALTAA